MTINEPMEMEKVYEADMEFYICGRCHYKFLVAERCPECAQLVKIKTDLNSGLFYDKVSLYELDIPNTWKNDIRKKLIGLLHDLVVDSQYKLVENHTDKSADIIDVMDASGRRIMGFAARKRNMVIGAFFNHEVYCSINRKMKLPENNKPKKSQDHVMINLNELWNIFCILTANDDKMV